MSARSHDNDDDDDDDDDDVVVVVCCLLRTLSEAARVLFVDEFITQTSALPANTKQTHVDSMQNVSERNYNFVR